MENNSRLEKLLSVIHYSMILILVFLFVSTNTSNINHAKMINQKENSSNEIPTKEFAYTFKVSDKLTGNGTILLSFQKNKLSGKASGLGMTCQCDVNFLSNITGSLDDSNKKLNVEMEGTGDPIGILIPGKITFRGPLKGFLSNGKVCLAGKVDIIGRLASLAGFEKKEDILIEIQDPSLAKTFKKIQSSEDLASL